jgi:ligand-binding SRPBCC domain-containing protein
MKVFKHEFKVNAPLVKVADFHSDSKALKLLTPPPLLVQFNSVEPLEDGSVADFTIWLGLIPVRWKAVHSEVDPLSGFIDAQMIGPFKIWEHRHTFLETGSESTIIKDEIRAEFSWHPYRRMLSWLMWVNLPFLFAYRAWRTRQELES